MSQSTYQKLLKLGAILSFVGFFIVDKNLYFPFITGKQFYFNILMEVLVVLWLAYIVKFPAERPKKSWITWALVAFYSAVLASAIFGIDFNLSFWGDAERMLGWFSIIHLLVLYFIIITVFKSDHDWLWLFIASIVSALSLALYAFFTAQGMKAIGNVNMTSNISTLGNATYVAGVMSFNFFFAWYLWFKSKDWTFKLVLAIVVFAIIKAFFYADVSGSQAGWAMGIIVMLGIAGVLSRERQVRRWTWIGLASFVVAVVLLFSFRDAAIFDNNKMGKVLRDFNSNNTTFRTRTYAWRAAWLGFLENPILGNGFGNFADYFDRHFVGSFYDWGINEEYYDRAHNNLLDILSTGGLISFLAYLAIFVALGYYLVGGARRGSISPLELSVVSGALVSYFIHNLAVFDALANYILLFIALAFVYYLSNRSPQVADNRAVKDKPIKLFGAWELNEKRVWFFGGLIVLFVIYNYNLMPREVFRLSVGAASAWVNDPNPQTAWDAYRRALAMETPLNRDCRMLWTSNIISNPAKMNQMDPQKRKEALDYAIELVDENLKLNPNDSLTLTSLARLQVTAFRLTSVAGYLEDALQSARRASDNGGQHIPPMLLQANILMAMERLSEAREVLLQAKSYYEPYPDLACYLAKLDLNTDVETAETFTAVSKCLDSSRGQQLIGVGSHLTKLEPYYLEQKDYRRLAKIYELMLAMDKKNEKLWDKLYRAYSDAGDRQKAEATLEARDQVMSGAPAPVKDY